MLMKILLAGGGSGGHVTPLKAIVEAIGESGGEHSFVVMTDRVFYPQTKLLFAQENVAIKRIFSGKLRRYSGKSILWHIVHIPTLFKNLRDFVLVGLGIIQSIHYFLWHRPDVVFAKGGYVCVPIGLAARILKVRLVIHDSDTHPGLANRFLARWAQVIATGMPTKYYTYAKSKMIYTGIPVSKLLQPISVSRQLEYKASIGGDSKRPLLLTTGGGTGAQKLNELIIYAAPELLSAGWQIVQITGVGKGQSALQAHSKLPHNQQNRWKIYEFVDLPPFILAADVIISRTGASAMQEFANAKKVVITIPAPQLPGDHQTKNARMFERAKSVVTLSEPATLDKPERIVEVVTQLFSDDTYRQSLARNLHTKFAKPEAAQMLAKIIVDTNFVGSA